MSTHQHQNEDFFRNHERLFRDFERDFQRSFGGMQSLPFAGIGSSFRQEQPMLSWVEDDFFLPITQCQESTSCTKEIDTHLHEINNKFEQDYKKLRQNYETQLRDVYEKQQDKQKGIQDAGQGVQGQQQQAQQSPQQAQQQATAHQQKGQQQTAHQKKAATGVSQGKQNPAGSMEVENERKSKQPATDDVYEYYFTSTRSLKDGKETGETVEKKEKIVEGKKILETKVTKYNPDGTKDVHCITEDENGKKEKKLRLDNKDKPLQLQ